MAATEIWSTVAISASLSVGGVSPRRALDLGICRVEIGVNSGGLAVILE